MSSPPRLRRSPARQALHERSESQTNERGSPTLRLVEDPQSPVSDIGPYPTKPSQILVPSGQYAPPPGRWKDGSSEQFRFESSSTFVQDPEPTKEGRFIDHGRNERDEEIPYGSSTDISYHTGYGSQSTVYATPGTEHGGSSATLDPLALPTSQHAWSVSSFKQETRPHDESADTGPRDGRQPANKDSDNSLSSTNTTGTVIVKKKRASYSAFPYSTRPGSSKSNLSSPASNNSNTALPEESFIWKSSDTPSVSNSPTLPSRERRISSAPTVNASGDSPGAATRLQYPVIRPPSASGSWAYSSSQPPPVPAKAAEREQQRWNPHLSTVPSEGGTDSLSLTRSSGLAPDSARASQSSSKVFPTSAPPSSSPEPERGSPGYQKSSKSAFVTSLMPSPPSPDVSPPPPIRSRDFSGSTIRVVGGEEEGIEKLKIPPTIPGSRDSAQPDVIGSRRPKAEIVTRPSSTASFFRDSMPAWAKSYYKRPNSPALFSRRDSINAENVGINIWQPRTRDQQRPERPDRRRSGLAMHPTRPEDFVSASGRGLPRRLSPTPSAHLWRDRASVYQRRSFFLAPSIDEAAEGHALTKRNIQVFSFALGFVIPFCWFIAAFLPLPPKPAPTSPKGKNAQRGSEIALYLEKQLGPTDLSRYENARWWRNINRLMCVVGATIIILIIALAAASST